MPIIYWRKMQYFLICKKCRLVTFFDFNYRSSRPEVSLGKGVLKICSKYTGEQPCWSVISIKLLCLNFSMGVLLEICSIFSGHLSLRTCLEGCFCNYIITKGLNYIKEYSSKKMKINKIICSFRKHERFIYLKINNDLNGAQKLQQMYKCRILVIFIKEVDIYYLKLSKWLLFSLFKVVL